MRQRVGINGTGLLKALFGKRKSGVIAVVEVGCSYSEKPKQAKRSADYLKFLLGAYCGTEVEVYPGVSYWHGPDEDGIAEDMKRFGIRFAVYHKGMPRGTLSSLDLETSMHLASMAGGLEHELTDDSAARVIVDDEKRHDSSYSNLRGELAHVASRSMFSRALEKLERDSSISSRIMDCDIGQRNLRIDGKEIIVADNGQIDIVMTFPNYNGLDSFLGELKSKPYMQVIDILE